MRTQYDAGEALFEFARLLEEKWDGAAGYESGAALADVVVNAYKAAGDLLPLKVPPPARKPPVKPADTE